MILLPLWPITHIGEGRVLFSLSPLAPLRVHGAQDPGLIRIYLPESGPFARGADGSFLARRTCGPLGLLALTPQPVSAEQVVCIPRCAECQKVWLPRRLFPGAFRA